MPLALSIKLVTIANCFSASEAPVPARSKLHLSFPCFVNLSIVKPSSTIIGSDCFAKGSADDKAFGLLTFFDKVKYSKTFEICLSSLNC